MSEYAIHYHIAVNSLQKHLYDVTLTIAKPNPEGQALTLPAWIPGSYMIRDFAKNIVVLEAFSADGKPLACHKTDKQSWQVAPHDGPVTLQYQVYAFDLSVRCAFLDSELGFSNSTSTFLAVVGQEEQAVKVTVAPVAAKPDWRLSTTMTPIARDPQGFGEFSVSGYRDLIEHPLLMADLATTSFQVQGVDFQMHLAGGHSTDLERMNRDLQKIAAHHIALFGNPVPIDRYEFQTMLTDNDYGGLEHTYSTALVFPRGRLPSVSEADTMTDGYREFLGLCSHELFHTWHVKRNRPEALIKPDLSQETYTEQLWIYEGITSYYDDFSLFRADIISQQSYLELLGKALTRLQRTAGRFKQSVTESSFDAWSKFYKQDENAPNAIVSYYVKGAVVALCLDLIIRQQSQGSKSLDNLMQALWQEHGAIEKGTAIDVIQTLCKHHLNIDVSDFLDLALYSTEELPVAELLAPFGVKLHLTPRSSDKDPGGKPNSSPLKVAFGAAYQAHNGGCRINNVLENSPAQQAGLAKNDTLIALNGWQINASNLSEQLQKLTIGDTAELQLFRRGKLMSTQMPIAAAQADTVYLEIEDEEKVKGWLQKTV